MFTENYFKFRQSLFYGNNGYAYSYKAFDGTNVSGTSANFWGYDIGYIMRYGRCRTMTADSSAQGVYFGSGATPAQKNDYTLENAITSGLTITNAENPVESNPSAGVYEFSVFFAVKNTSDADITINEVGLFSNISGNGKPILFERTVLASPITITPGAAKAITYKITFNQSQ